MALHKMVPTKQANTTDGLTDWGARQKLLGCQMSPVAFAQGTLTGA